MVFVLVLEVRGRRFLLLAPCWAMWLGVTRVDDVDKVLADGVLAADKALAGARAIEVPMAFGRVLAASLTA